MTVKQVAAIQTGGTSSKMAAEPSKRERVLREAERLFAQEGFHGVTMRDIAKASDVNLALIVYHFETKNKLYHAIFEHRKDLFGERLGELRVVTDFDAPDALERIVHAFVAPVLRSQMSSAGKSYAQLVARESSDPSEATRGIVKEYFDPFAIEFIQALRQALPRKSLDYVHWAYMFAVGALVMSVFDSRLPRITGGKTKPTDLSKPAEVNKKTQYLCAFICAGIRGGPDVPTPP